MNVDTLWMFILGDFSKLIDPNASNDSETREMQDFVKR